MHDLHNVSDAIEYLVGITGDKDHPHIGIVCAVTAVWMNPELLDRIANTCRYISRASGRSLMQIFEYLFSIGERPRREAYLHPP